MRFAKFHDGTFAIALEDVADGFIEYGLFAAVHFRGGGFFGSFCG